MIGKEFYIKVYDSDGSTYKGVMTKVQDLSFTQYINAGQGELEFTLLEKFDDFDEGGLVNHMNVIKVIISKEGSSGEHVYTGFIDWYNPFINENGEGVRIHCIGHTAIFAETTYMNGTDVTMSHTSATIDTIVSDIITKYRATQSSFYNGLISEGTVDSTNITTSYTFNVMSSLESIEKCREFVGEDWYWYVNPDLELDFKMSPTEPTHVFTFGRHIIGLNLIKTVGEIKNNFIFWDGKTSSSISRHYENTVSAEKYARRFKRILDGRVSSTSTAEKMARYYNGLYGSYNHTSDFRVSNNYDTESIFPGDTCKIININSDSVFSDNMRITSVSYTLDYVDITVEDLRTQTSRELAELNKKIYAKDYNDDQPNVTYVDINYGDWSSTTTTSAPSARRNHTMIWTGTYAIVWGGYNGSTLNTGSRYNLSADSWSPTTTTGALSGRYRHTAVWDSTNSVMVVWGGHTSSTYSSAGNRYNPSTDSWSSTTTTGAPSARYSHTAVFDSSNNKVLVWGGYNGSYLNTGGMYDASVDSWSTITTTGAPSARHAHTAVFDDSNNKMIIFGGYGSGYKSDGGVYNPSTNSWASLPSTNTPSAREWHTAVWTGSKMIVWGGRYKSGSTWYYRDTGAIYNPSTNTWSAMTTTGTPAGRYSHTAIWDSTNSKMLIFGGWNGGYLNDLWAYDLTNDSWEHLTDYNAPDTRYQHRAIIDNSNKKMMLWGGYNGSYLNNGGVFSIN